MTFAPQSILEVRWEFQRYTNLSNVALGIVRNERDTSYHVGESWLKPGAYSVNESSRDRRGLSEASSAIDIGWWSITKHGKTHNLRTFSAWLVNECKNNAPDTRDIREIIWSPDGDIVLRYDDLGIRASGDRRHRTHTHISWYRDSENNNRAAVIRRYFREVVEGITEENDMTNEQITQMFTLLTTNLTATRQVGGNVVELQQRVNDLETKLNELIAKHPTT